IAGEVRRWRDVVQELALVSTELDALERLEASPTVVTLIEREPHRAVGVTVEGIPVEVVVAARERFGTELVRATGSPEYVASLGELPDVATEEELYARLGLPWCPPRRHPRPSRRGTCGARLGAALTPCGAAGRRRPADQESRRGDAASCGALPEPSEGADHQSPAAERADARTRDRGRARRGCRTGDERSAGPARPARRGGAPRGRGRSADRVLDRRPLGARA